MILAIANEKGGVGKTVTAVNLSTTLAEAGREVLLLDLDAQHDALAFRDSTAAMFSTQIATPRQLAAHRTAAQEKSNAGQLVLLDCPPSLGKEVAGALSVSDLVIVPINAEYSALRGLARLLETMDAARAAGNKSLQYKILLTMFDTRANHCHAIENQVREAFGKNVFQTRVPRSYKFADAALEHQPITQFAPRSAGAAAYRALAQEVLSLC
jgi:chromosome partitioning protein